MDELKRAERLLVGFNGWLPFLSRSSSPNQEIRLDDFVEVGSFPFGDSSLLTDKEYLAQVGEVAASFGGKYFYVESYFNILVGRAVGDVRVGLLRSESAADHFGAFGSLARGDLDSFRSQLKE
ncbi:hypothetical protein KA107_00185 [Candidatus Pacearchaeota archaeon]|nr:hypothetical protein [Candidatus Pacearchaeota archaeon]